PSNPNGVPALDQATAPHKLQKRRSACHCRHRPSPRRAGRTRAASTAMPAPRRSSSGARRVRALSGWRPAWLLPARCCAATATPTRRPMMRSRTTTRCRTWPQAC
ncbi:hypothetical protein SM139_3194, partial [Stenotrophomonas maltophilia]